MTWARTIKVRVSFTDDEDNEETLTSEATAEVLAMVPTEPLRLTVAKGDKIEELDASWQAPSTNGGSAITGYKVQWKEAADSWNTAADVSEATVPGTTHTITGLTGGVEYAVRVIATNDVGDGLASTEAKGTPAGGVSEQNAEPENTEPTGLPTIGGAPQVGEMLTADTSGIADEDGLDDVSYSYQWVAGDTDIDGATGSSYVLTSSEQGKTIKVKVSFTDDANNQETLTSAATVAIMPQADNAELTVPIWSADMLVVEYTTVSIGAASADLFSNVGGSAGLHIKSLWSYTLDRDLRLAFEEAVPGAADLTLQVGDLKLPFPAGSSGASSFKWTDVDVDWEDGQTIAVSIFPTSLMEEPTPNRDATGAPTISGTPQVDQTLTADTSAINDEDGLIGVSYRYQWIRSDNGADSDIAGATSSTYTLVYADQGNTIKLTVNFTDDAENEETLTSVATVAVAAAPNREATGDPAISGTPQVDRTLTASISAIADQDGLDGVSYNYQWTADGTDIQDATDSTYTPSLSDVGKTVKVKVSFTDDRNNAESRTSAATAVVTPTVPTQPLSLTVATGDEIQKLDASWQAPSSNGGSAVTGYKVQWKEAADSWDTAADVSQTAVTGTTHTITGLTGGVEYAVRVIATNSAGDGLASAEAKGTPAAENNAPTGLPGISGTAQVGETLTASTANIDDEDGLTNVSYRYQWIANDGETDTEVEGATGSTYTLTAAAAGKTIKVKVSFTDDADNQESLTSEDTDTVAATKPGVPGHLNVFPHDAGALDVYWEAPASDGGSAVTGYKVQWKESADSWDTPADVSEATASGTSHTITGLTDGLEYSVRVLATNGAGDSPPSVEQTGTPRETKVPEMVRPRVDGATLKVLYDEALDEGSAPPTDSFDVRVACTCGDTTWLDEEAKRAVESVSVDGDTVVLTLVSAATSEDVVVVSYTPPSDAATARTRDLAGNAAAGFNATEVFNDTDETAESEKSGEPEETTEGETPLTVSLGATTESHNGTDAFTFELRFSEEVKLSYVTLRDHAFTVTGGTVNRAKRLTQGSNIGWTITVTPGSAAAVTVVLPVTTDCDADGAVCTGDGRELSNRLEFTVSGPGQ